MGLTNPFMALRRLSDEMERFFHLGGLGDFRFPRPWRDFDVMSAWGPDVDVSERKGQLVIRADLPGVNKDDLKVEVTDSDLTISGERTSEETEEKEGFYRKERSYGSFQRTLRLPEGAKTDGVNASYKDGVLEVTIPCPTAKKKGRNVTIKS